MRRMPSAELSGSCFGFHRAEKASAAVMSQGRPSGRRGLYEEHRSTGDQEPKRRKKDAECILAGTRFRFGKAPVEPFGGCSVMPG